VNCSDIELLLSAERDGMLPPRQRSALEKHIASCATCAKSRADISQAMNAFKREVAAVSVPDPDEEWQKLRANLTEGGVRQREKRRLAPILWFATPLAAAAAVAFAFFNSSSTPPSNSNSVTMTAAGEMAQAEYVEPGNAKASTIVYVDKDSGWLVVWASDGESDPTI
jgi:anti-sigma factor RsiW